MCFTITFLGTGAAVPTLNRGTSSQFIDCHQRKILIDCGEGTQLKLRQAKIKFQNLQLVLISHLHGDHVLGLPGLISTMQLLGRVQPLQVIGPKGIKKFVLTQLKLTYGYLGFHIEFTELEKEQTGVVFEDKCLSVSTFPLLHRVPTQGYRIEEKIGKRPLNKEAFDATGVSVAYIEKLKAGMDVTDNDGREVKYLDVTFPPKPTKAYAYCSDTKYNEEMLQYIENVNLLYHEATFVEKERQRAQDTFHSTAKDAAKIALKAKVGKLVLGHFSARYTETIEHLKEAKTIFKNVCVPEDGMTLKL